MPTIARIGPYRFFFFSNEGTEPMHVHVQREQKLAKFWLDPVSHAGSTGFPGHELTQIEAIVVANRERFMEVWHEFFGR
jgi:hypothetical protein